MVFLAGFEPHLSHLHFAGRLCVSNVFAVPLHYRSGDYSLSHRFDMDAVHSVSSFSHCYGWMAPFVATIFWAKKVANQGWSSTSPKFLTSIHKGCGAYGKRRMTR